MAEPPSGQEEVPPPPSALKPAPVAILSSMSDTETRVFIAALRRGLASAAVPSGTVAGTAGNGVYIADVLTGRLDADDPDAEAWWRTVEEGSLHPGAVILCGNQALRSYRYRRTALDVPVFHFAPGGYDTPFLAATFPLGRPVIPMAPSASALGIPDRMGRSLGFGLVLVVGNQDALEAGEIRKALATRDSREPVEIRMAGRKEFLSGTDLASFLSDARPRAILYAAAADPELVAALALASRDYRIPLLCSGPPSGLMQGRVVAWMDPRPDADFSRMLGMTLLGTLSGVARPLPPRPPASLVVNMEAARDAGVHPDAATAFVQGFLLGGGN